MGGWILTPLAADELKVILGYIVRESGSQAIADGVLIEFLSGFERLAENPYMGTMDAAQALDGSPVHGDL